MDKLSKEEVLHVANLGRLALKDEEIEDYSIKLKQILNEIEKINDIETKDEEILITPNSINTKLRDKDLTHEITTEEALKNAPKTYENYIEIRGVFND